MGGGANVPPLQAPADACSQKRPQLLLEVVVAISCPGITPGAVGMVAGVYMPPLTKAAPAAHGDIVLTLESSVHIQIQTPRHISIELLLHIA